MRNSPPEADSQRAREDKGRGWALGPGPWKIPVQAAGAGTLDCESEARTGSKPLTLDKALQVLPALHVLM